MRVIAGSERGRKLITLDGQDTRPTLDRVREAMFNMLQPWIYDARVLDLFAGSGALGIEAISRGAVHATFNDKSKQACRVIETNINVLGYKDKSSVFSLDYQDFIKKTLQKGDRFDIIMLDAPYASGFISDCAEDCKKLLQPGGVIMVEHDENTVFTDDVRKTKKYGAVRVTLLGVD